MSRIPPNLVESLERYGYQKSHQSHKHNNIKYLTHTLSRIVMRNPSHEIRKQLYRLHQIIKNVFISMPDDEINWLLGGVDVARGGFKDAKSFKVFFQKDPEKITTSRLITAFDTLTTAIGYRAIDRDSGHPPIKPDPSQPGYTMYTKIHALLDGKFQPYPEEKTYSARGFDWYESPGDSDTVQGSYIETEADVVSDASDVEDEEERQPGAPVAGIRFHQILAPGMEKESWPAAASRGGIPIRAHLSGTVPLALTVLEQLYAISGETWFQYDDNVRKLSGAIFLPAYERGDFHTIAETAGSVAYFLQSRAKVNSLPIPPKQCLQIGLEYMQSATEDEIQKIIKASSDFILSNTVDIPAMMQLHFSDALRIIEYSHDLPLVKKTIERFTSIILEARTDPPKEKIQALSKLFVSLEKSIAFNKKSSCAILFFPKINAHDIFESLKLRIKMGVDEILRDNTNLDIAELIKEDASISELLKGIRQLR